MHLSTIHQLGLAAMRGSPFRDPQTSREVDAALVRSTLAGDRQALRELVDRNRPWVYNIARRMLLNPQDAEDTTQGVMLRVLSHLSTFDPERASLRTWMYRITTNHILNLKRRKIEEAIEGFEAYGRSLDSLDDDASGESRLADPEFKLMVEEAKVSCMAGMLLCLSREQRLVFVLGEILGASDVVAADILGVDRVTFRKQLSRAREDLYNFMNEKCGLVNEVNPCRCHRKTQAFVREGWVDAKNLRFSAPHEKRILEVAQSKADQCDVLFAEKYAALYQSHPFYEPSESTEALKTLLSDEGFARLFELEKSDDRKSS